MTPWRLLVLTVLGYIAWRLLRGILRGKGADRSFDEAAGPPSEDVLVEDPVCHVLLPRGQAIRLRRDGVTRYFCSERCCDIYAREYPKEES